MSILSLRRPRGNIWGTADKQSASITSDLLPRTFAGHEDNDCIHVLDVGAGMSETVEFLKQYRCKVYFLDLASVIEDGERGSIAEVFGEYSGELFDVCLFWDLLHRLTTTQLEELSDELEPYVYSKTQVHTLANLTDPSESYRIRGIDQLAVAKQQVHDYPTRSVTQLTRHFRCFEILTDEFRADGRLEMVLVP